MIRTLALGLLLLTATGALALNPPWFFVHSQLETALEGPNVRVGELVSDGRSWVVPLDVVGDERAAIAKALAAALRPTHLGGMVRVEVRVDGTVVPPDPPAASTPAEAVALLQQALAGNPHAAGVYATDTGALVEAVPEILQFYADDLSDRRGLAHFGAADLLRQVLDGERFAGLTIHVSYAAR